MSLADNILAAALDCCWDTDLCQLLDAPSDVQIWSSASSEADVNDTTTPVLAPNLPDMSALSGVTSAPKYIDSTATRLCEPLFDAEKHALPLWQVLGTNKMVLNWITNGVHFTLNCIPQPFHHRHAAGMPADYIAYWKEH